ncbi:MAG: DUF4173 domain-containing protein [Ruminococcus sp.]|nr:DUF4173 domain-containing protein [Ruminococcus sp.]
MMDIKETVINEDGSVAAPSNPCSYSPSRKKEVPEYGKAEEILSALIFVFSVIYVRYVVFFTTGLISTLLYFALITTGVIYLRVKNYHFSRFNTALTVVLYLFSTVFTITDNGFIKFLNAVFLFAAGAYLVYSVCAEKREIERYLPFAVKSSLIDYPLNKLDCQLNIFGDSFKSRDTGSNLKKIIGGLFLTIPLTLIVGSLLMEADDGLNSLFSCMFSDIDEEEVYMWILTVLIALPCSCYFFGIFYRNAFRKDLKELTDEECAEKLMKKRKVSNLVFHSAAAPILLLYVMFFISQTGYFLSAFMGRLPDGFSYAEYARKGFFELCWIVVINLGIMIVMNVYSKKCGNEKTTALKVYNIIFCIFTLILLATVLSKMGMYMGAYGLTVLRVQTTWFMLLCTYIFLIILIKQFRPGMHISKHITVGFTIMFTFLCFSRTEYLIVKYNAVTGKVTTENVDRSGIHSMTDDGLLAAVEEGLMSAHDAQEISGYRHDERATDILNASTLMLSSK